MESNDFEESMVRGEKLVEQGNFLEAKVIFEDLLKKDDWPTEELRGKAFLLLGRVAMYQGNFDRALMHFGTARRKHPTPSWVLIESLRCEGVVMSEKGNFERAMELYETALSHARTINHQKAIASCLNNVALIHTFRGEFDKALDLFDEGLAIAVEAEDKEESSKFLNNMAEIFSRRGQYDLAYEHYNRSLALDRKRGDNQGAAICLNNIAEIYKARGDYQKSILYLQDAYNIFMESGYKRGLGVILSNLGELHWLEGDLRKAIEVLNQGINICREVGIEDEMYYRMLLLLTGVQTDRGNLETAESLLDQCRTLNERLQSDLLAAEIFYVQGYLESPRKGKGNLSNAKKAYSKALELAGKEKLNLAEIWMNASLGMADVNLGQYENTLDDEYLLEAEKRLLTVFNRAKNEEQIPILCQVIQLQGLLSIAHMSHDDALELFAEAKRTAERKGLTFLAEQAQKQYNKAVELKSRSQKLLSKDADAVKDVMDYVKERVREVQRMLQTYGGG